MSSDVVQDAKSRLIIFHRTSWWFIDEADGMVGPYRTHGQAWRALVSYALYELGLMIEDIYG